MFVCGAAILTEINMQINSKKFAILPFGLQYANPCTKMWFKNSPMSSLVLITSTKNEKQMLDIFRTKCYTVETIVTTLRLMSVNI